MKILPWMLCLPLSWSLLCGQSQTTTSPDTPSPEQLQKISLTVEQLRALVKIGREQRADEQLIDKLLADIEDIVRRAESAEARAADLEMRLKILERDAEDLRVNLVEAKDALKEERNAEKWRRIKWFGIGAAIGIGIGAAIGAAVS